MSAIALFVVLLAFSHLNNTKLEILVYATYMTSVCTITYICTTSSITTNKVPPLTFTKQTAGLHSREKYKIVLNKKKSKT